MQDIGKAQSTSAGVLADNDGAHADVQSTAGFFYSAALIAATALAGQAAGPARVPVLGQIALPHNYYFRELYLPQLTSGPSSVAWSSDGSSLIYSMQGNLWRQRVDSPDAEQLTDDRASDYQPDCSPDGRRVAFVRYDGKSMELMLLDLASRSVRPLTANGAVNVEPRWSPAGDRLAFVSTAQTGHFLLHVADVREDRLQSLRPVMPDRRSAIARYYYSPFDHAINPAWTRDGRELIFVSNREIAPRHRRHRADAGQWNGGATRPAARRDIVACQA